MAVSMVMRRDADRQGGRRGRNLAVLLALLALVVVLFSVTIVKLGSNAVNPAARSGESWGMVLIEWLEGEAPAGEVGSTDPAAGKVAE